MMKLFTMYKGLPGSGKTTEAMKRIREGQAKGQRIIRVNKDDIRAELGLLWSPVSEIRVREIRDLRITNALMDATIHDVISDDTNLDPMHEAQFRILVADLAGQADPQGIKFQVIPLMTPPDECIRRDRLRVGTAHVGAQVIYQMANRYQWPNPVVKADIEPLTGEAPTALICDLDGTVSLFGPGINDRSPYDASTCDKDGVNGSVRRLLEIYYRFMGYKILYVSGRFERYRPQTETWMRTHHLPPGPLWMRPDLDTRHDHILKLEIFNREIRDTYSVDFVLDDRDQVVQMWRALGLRCFQVAPEDF